MAARDGCVTGCDGVLSSPSLSPSPLAHTARASDISIVLLIQTPPGTHTLLWLTVLVMTLDVFWGYMLARKRGEAQSNRLRDGIYRRLYMLTLLMVLTIFAAVQPALFGMEVLGREVNALWFFYIGAITSELKSLTEKAEPLGLKDHFVIQTLRTLVGRWTNAKSGS